VQLPNQGQDAVPKGGQSGYALGVNDELARMQLTGNQLHQQGQAEIAAPQWTESNQTHQGPMMAPDAAAPVGVATMVFPFLNTRHLVTILGDQQRVHGGQIRSVNLELLPQFRFEGFQQCATDSHRVPAVFSQEAFPASQVAVNPKAGVGRTTHRFATTSEQEAQNVASEVDETWFGEMGPEQRQIAEQDCWH
jgi:hypothetical protein